MTDEKIFTPRRVPQGCADAAIYFQQTMEACFASLLYKHLLIWIDDLLLYANSINTYLDKLQELFFLLDKYGLKLSTKKTSLYQTSVKWCGKIITGEGISHDPKRIDALQAIPCPTTAGQLQQFLCAVNWMRSSIVDYARLVLPLSNKLNEALKRTKRTTRVAASIRIDLNANEQIAFDTGKRKLSESAMLTYPDDSATTCLITDASDYGWALIVTQVKEWTSTKPIEQQQHQLLTCMSGTFAGSQSNWSVTEKEASP